MTGRRWQSYANPFKRSAASHRFEDELREREAERQADATFHLALRDEHDEGEHRGRRVPLCAFCDRTAR